VKKVAAKPGVLTGMIKIWQNLRWGQRLGALSALIAVFYPLPEAWAVVGYLAKLGPPPLRIWMNSTNVFDYSRFELALMAKAQAKPDANSGTNQMAISVTETNTEPLRLDNSTTTGKATMGQNYSSGTSPDTSTEDQSGAMPRGNFSFPGTTASDLLTVTPQMIAQYLKPESYGTNTMDRPGAVVFVPADMPFVPPPVKANSDSRASYHVK